LNAPYQALRTSDGHFTVGAANDKLWPMFCRLLGRDDLPRDPRFATVAGRVKNRAALEAELERVTSTQTRAHWLARCEEIGIPAGPINTVPEAHADPHAIARSMVQEIDHPDAGRIKALGNPVKMSKSPPQLRKAAPRLGEDTRALLGELGYASAEVESLMRAVAVR
jgi:formyl-CoA transferase